MRAPPAGIDEPPGAGGLPGAPPGVLEPYHLAEKLAQRPPQALFDTKRLGRELIEMDTESALSRMFDVISARQRSDEYQAAIERYVEQLGGR